MESGVESIAEAKPGSKGRQESTCGPSGTDLGQSLHNFCRYLEQFFGQKYYHMHVGTNLCPLPCCTCIACTFPVLSFYCRLITESNLYTFVSLCSPPAQNVSLETNHGHLSPSGTRYRYKSLEFLSCINIYVYL